MLSQTASKQSETRHNSNCSPILFLLKALDPPIFGRFPEDNFRVRSIGPLRARAASGSFQPMIDD
jgi:hypothetical protein